MRKLRYIIPQLLFPRHNYVSWGNGNIDVSKPSTVTVRARFEAANDAEVGGAALGDMAVTVHGNKGKHSSSVG